MREILFRGKRADNGEWIYGYVNQHRGEPILDCMCEQINSDDFYIDDYAAKIDTGIYGLLYKIIPETVGQYTGLIDKNGVRIFEGDIVHCVSKLDSADMVVIFECGQFRMILAKKHHEYQTNAGYYDINCFEKEVIGNIHENPELLDREEL